MAEAAVRSGDLDRAEALAQAIRKPYQRARGLALVAEAVARAGDQERAEALARVITKPDLQARVLVNLAKKAELNRAQSLLAHALAVGHWETSVEVLAQIDPDAVFAIANEYLAWLRQ